MYHLKKAKMSEFVSDIQKYMFVGKECDAIFESPKTVVSLAHGTCRLLSLASLEWNVFLSLQLCNLPAIKAASSMVPLGIVKSRVIVNVSPAFNSDGISSAPASVKSISGVSIVFDHESYRMPAAKFKSKSSKHKLLKRSKIVKSALWSIITQTYNYLWAIW